MLSRKFIGKIGWQYALGEVVFIFIGITTAIWFNNWNNALKENEIEINTLEEIRNALGQDLKDLKLNTEGYTTRSEIFKTILKYMKDNIPQNDTINRYCSFLSGYTKFLSNTGAYETLKSRGLETISNDSIRLKISAYYDVTCEWLLFNEGIYFNHHQNDLKRVIQRLFYVNEWGLEIIDYQKLLDDFEFYQVLSWQIRNEQSMDRATKGSIEILEKLIQEIDEEIKRLK